MEPPSVPILPQGPSPYSAATTAPVQAESSNSTVVQSPSAVLEARQAPSEATLLLASLSISTVSPAISPAGFSFTAAGRFSARTARTLRPSFRSLLISNRLGFFQSALEPISLPLIHTVNLSSAETNKGALFMLASAGSSTARRKTRASAGASRLGSPSGNQIHWPQAGESVLSFQVAAPGCGSKGSKPKPPKNCLPHPRCREPGSFIASFQGIFP